MTQHRAQFRAHGGRAHRWLPDRTPPTKRGASLAALLACLLMPTAPAQGLTGTYLTETPGGVATLTLEQVGAYLSGSLLGPGIQLSLTGTVQGDVGGGLAVTEGEAVGFEARLGSGSLLLRLFELDENGDPISAGALEIAFTPRATPAPPGATGTSPATGPSTGETSGALSDDPVLATGGHGTLTVDNAKAFIEALEFVLEQIGYPYELTEADRAQALEELKAGYPQAAPEDQALLAQSREVWQRVQANWDATATEEREEFALGVLVLAFGEDTVRSWLRSGSAGGGLGASTDCATFEDCTSSFVDQETWTDTFNTQGCWAAAGCGGYDASTNTFTYDGY